MADPNLERYVELKREISQLEKELDELKEAIFRTVDGAGGEVAEDKFVLKTQKRPKYKFSDSYEAKNKELKDLKKAEISNGVATIDGYSEFVTVKFKD
ncbi:hypothetical protein OAG68_02030 [bacterium]|nr:hypothetical protein [bacterium]